MANEPTDTLMTFILPSGAGVPADCTSVWDPSDTQMSADFTPRFFFEIQDFSLGGGLESEESEREKTTGTSGGGPTGSNGLVSRNPQTGDDGKGTSKRSARGNKFAKYILEGSLKYPIDLQEISVSRQMDKASPTLLLNCLTLTAFTKAVIVKRKVVGGVLANGEVHHMGYLRLEFEKPLITSVDWDDDGEFVKEKLKFVCRGLKVAYRPQKNDGTLDSAVSMEWTPSRALSGGSGG